MRCSELGRAGPKARPIADAPLVDGGTEATSLDPRDPEFRIDFLTPLHLGGSEPFVHPQLGVALQPLNFMEYLLDDVQQAAMFSAAGAVLVNLPHPARYALHKLIVAGERPASRMAKSTKDVLQTAALLEALQAQGVDWQMRDAWDDLTERGPGWVSRVRRGHAALAKVVPNLAIESVLPSVD